MERLLRYVVYLASALVLIWTAGQLMRVFVCDSFVVRGFSMEPALHDGERVYVNKLKAGARIYTDLDFESPHLSSFRLPGFRDVRVGIDCQRSSGESYVLLYLKPETVLQII